MVLYEIVRELKQGILEMDTLRMLDPPGNLKGECTHETGYRSRDDYIRTLFARICACRERGVDDV